MSRSRSIVVACALLLAFAVTTGPLQAQSRTTGALTGRVVDDSGAPLVGAAVELTGEALIGGARTAQTDSAGRFRFVELPPGPYSVAVSLQGFAPLKRESVPVALGVTVELPLTLTIEKVEETLEVFGEAPTIDTTSSGTSVNLSNDYLQNLPTARFQPDVLNLAPGINLDSAYGGGESSANAYQIDGVDVSDPEGGTPWAFVNYNIIQEAQLVGLGAPAEYGGFTGVVFNSVTKSGGNKLKGLAEVLYTNDALTASNSDIPGLAPRIDKSYDSTLQLGGPILTDRLWYFASAQYLGDIQSDGGPLRTEHDPRLFGKATWQITDSHSLEAWGEWDRFDVIGRGGDAFTPLEATVTEKAPEVVWNLTDRWLISDKTIANVAYAGYTGYYYLDPQEGYGIPGRLDAITGNYLDNSYYFFLADRDRNQLNASVSHYASNFIAGDHDFKFGMEVERSTVRNRYGYTTGVWYYDNYGTDVDPGSDSYDPVPYSLGYFGGGYDVHATNERLSLYGQDTWRVSPRLTINPGIRADLNRGKVRSGEVFSTNPIAPRLGFAWDMTGDGKTLLKGHYGRYYEALFAGYYYWVDPGAFESVEIRRVFPSGATDLVSETAGASYAIDPNVRHPYLDQYIFGLDREIRPGITLSGTLIYRKNKDLIETVSRDGEFVPVTGTVPETGQTVTLYDYLNPGDDTLLVTNPKGLQRKYEGVVITLNRRMRNNWDFLASYVYAKSTGNIDNLSGFNEAYGGNAPGSFLNTPNSLVNAQGKLTHDQRQQVKLQGTYQIPRLNLSLSGNYTYHSGDTWTKRTNCLLTDDDGDGELDCHDFPQGTVRYFAEARGSRRLPARNEIDLRAEWRHDLGRGDVGLFVDAFNLTNQGRALDVEDRDNSSFGEPKTFSSPRSFRLGARYLF